MKSEISLLSRGVCSCVFVVTLCFAIGTSTAQDDEAESEIKSKVLIKVPIVKQKRMLCGPATIEMLFKYWGVKKHDQFDIAKNILLEYPTLDRVVKSGILEDKKIDWKKYPGTGTSTMRKFLRLHATTRNHYIKDLPRDRKKRRELVQKQFDRVKKNLSNGIPVILLQKSARNPKSSHYRLAVGYDDEKEIVYLNDAAEGFSAEKT